MSSKPLFPSGDVGLEGHEPRRSCGQTFGEVLARRIERRSLLQAGALAPLFALGPVANLKGQKAGSGFTFAPLAGSADDAIAAPEGYQWEPLAAWGQPLTPAAPAFDPFQLDPAAQRQQVATTATSWLGSTTSTARALWA